MQATRPGSSSAPSRSPPDAPKTDRSAMTTQNAIHCSIFQIGAAGGVGRRLTALLTEQGHRVTGMHRASGQDAVIRGAGGTPVTGDLIEDSVATLAERLAGHDAVV